MPTWEHGPDLESSALFTTSLFSAPEWPINLAPHQLAATSFCYTSNYNSPELDVPFASHARSERLGVGSLQTAP